MKFETAKNLVKGFLIAGIVCSLLALITGRADSTLASMYLGLGSLGCILMCLFFVITGLKCPWCGRRIIRRCLSLRTWPHCRRNLATGMKAKGKKSR